MIDCMYLYSTFLKPRDCYIYILQCLMDHLQFLSKL